MKSRRRSVRGLATVLLEAILFAILTTATLTTVAPEFVARPVGGSTTEDDVSEVTAEWRSGGKTITVRTVKEDDETPTQFAERHKADVDAMEVVHPVDDG